MFINLKMMRNLISPDNVVPYLKERGYNYFCTGSGMLISLNNFTALSVYNYHGTGDTWCFWLEDDKLWSENICGFMIVFPLQKSIA